MKNSMIKRKMHSGQEIPTLFLSSNYYSHGFLVVFIYFHFVWSHPLLLINAEKRNKFWSLLQKEEDPLSVKMGCRTIETAAMEVFARHG